MHFFLICSLQLLFDQKMIDGYIWGFCLVFALLLIATSVLSG